MKWKCSCGAVFEYDRTASGLPDDRLERIWAMAQEWNASHHHEMPEPEGEVPMLVESSSSHERQLNEFGVTDRAPFGFRA